MIKLNHLIHRMPRFGRALSGARTAGTYTAVIVLVATASLGLTATGLANKASGGGDGATAVHIVTIDGPMDEINRRFLLDRLEASRDAGAQAVLIQIDSKGYVGGRWEDARDLAERVKASAVPVVVWAGPPGATVRRGSFWIYLAGHLRGTSPMSSAGEAIPSGLRGSLGATDVELQREYLRSAFPRVPETAFEDVLNVEELTATGLADFVAPTLGDAIVGLDGMTVTVTSPLGEQSIKTLRTAEIITTEIGPPLRQPAVEVLFFRLGFTDRILHSAANPGVAYMLVMAAIVLFALEFYTAGIGIVALLGAVCLLIGGYGLGSIGANLSTLFALGASVPLFAADIQRGIRTLATLGGVACTATALAAASIQGPPDLRLPIWLSAILGVLYIGAWRLGVVVMARTRYWAPVIAREKLVGMRAQVRDPLNPEGTVVLQKGKYAARSVEGRIPRGEEVVISGIAGWKLLVERVQKQRNNNGVRGDK
jgi:membrane-bound serine protease (ClpP class)